MGDVGWVPATDHNGEAVACPRCGGQTEYEYGMEGGEEMLDGERCKPCGWTVAFTDEGPVMR